MLIEPRFASTFDLFLSVTPTNLFAISAIPGTEVVGEVVAIT